MEPVLARDVLSFSSKLRLLDPKLKDDNEIRLVSD